MFNLMATKEVTYDDIDTAIGHLSKIERRDQVIKNPHVKEDGFIHYETKDGGVGKMPFLEVGMNYMLSMLKIPRSFAYNVVDDELLLDNINNLMPRQVYMSTEKVGEEEFVAGMAVKPYIPFRDYEFLESIKSERKDIRVRLLHRRQDELRLHYFDPVKSLEINIEDMPIDMGGDLRYSEYGKKLSVQAAILIEWCTNGSVLTEEVFSSTYNHKGDKFAANEAVRKALTGLHNLHGNPIAERFEMMKKVSPSEQYWNTIRRVINGTLGKEYAEENYFITRSMFDTFQQMTEDAHTTAVSVKDRRRLEVAGGVMLKDVKNSEYVVPFNGN